MFVERLEKALKEKNISKKQFLADLGLSINSISHWRNRGNVPAGKTLDRIAEYLDVSVDYLLGKSNTPESDNDIPVSDIMYKRIIDLCAANNISLENFASQIGISMRTLTQLGANRRISLSLKSTIKAADYFNVSIDYLLGKKESSISIDQGLYESSITILFSVIGKVRAGYGGMAQEEYTDETCPIPAEYIKGHKKEEFFVLRISGNSMYPKLLDGDKVLVQRCTSVDSGSVAIVLYDSEEATVKTVRYAQGEDWVELIPANPEYETKRIEGSDLMKVQILGKVTKLIRDI